MTIDPAEKSLNAQTGPVEDAVSDTSRVRSSEQTEAVAQPTLPPNPASETRPRIKIGSQRETAEKARPGESSEAASAPLPDRQTAKPAGEQISRQDGSEQQPDSGQQNLAEPPREAGQQAAEEPEVKQPSSDSVPVKSEPVSIPALSPELEQEVAAALGDLSLEQMLTGDKVAGADEDLLPDSRCQATVVKIHRDDVFFSLGARHEGVVSLRQFKQPPEPGTTMEVVVTRFNAEEGLYDLTIPGASIDVADWSDLAEGAVVEARVTGANTGGLECLVNNLPGFIPASQISLYRVENLSEFIGQKLQCVVTEANPNRRNLVLSHRAVLERERENARQSFLEQLEIGQIREGVVRSIRDFGAFVDLGGVDGLIHISKLSWDHVTHPSEVLQEGQKVSVKIEKIDPQTGKIGLSYRDVGAHPWTNIEQKYSSGAIVSGTVSRIAKFGAFVKLESGIEGLIHVSELAHYRVQRISSVVSEGQQVQVKVLSVDPDSQRIALSLKATQAASEEAAPQEPEVEEEPPRPLAVRPRKKPLKGGVDRPSGGDQFGLTW